MADERRGFYRHVFTGFGSDKSAELLLIVQMFETSLGHLREEMNERR